MSFSNILEDTRQYFQGLPSASPATTAPTPNNAVGSAPSPAAASPAQPPAPQQPQAYFPPQPGAGVPQQQQQPPSAGWTGKPYPFNNAAPPPSTSANPTYESPKPSYTFNNYNHAPATTTKPVVHNQVPSNNVQYQGKQAAYMYNNTGVGYETKQPSNHQEHNSTLLNLDRQQYDNRTTSNSSSSSRSLAASSTHQQYPTIATMDRAFAQQYSASKSDAHSFNSIPNNRHPTPSTVSYSVPPQSQYPSASPQTPQQYANPTQQYPTARPTKQSTNPQLQQQQLQQHLYSQQQLRQHLANTQAKQQLKMQQYQQQQQSASTAAKVQQYQQQQQQSAAGMSAKVQQYQQQAAATTIKVHNFQAPSNSTQLYHPSTNSTATSKMHPFQQVVPSNNKIHPYQAVPTSTNQYPQVAPSNSINSTSGKTSHYQASSSSTTLNKMHQFQTSNSAASNYQQSLPSSSSSKSHHFQSAISNSVGNNYQQQSVPSSSSSKVHQFQAALSSNTTAGSYQQSLPSSSTSKVHQFQASATNSTAGNYQSAPSSSSSSKFQGSAKFPSPSVVQAGKARQLQQAASSAGTYHNSQGYPTMATPISWFAAEMQSQHLRQPTKGEASSKSGDVTKQHMAAMQQASHMLQPPKAPPPAARHRSGPRRDSPLDLSVRTIRRSADSTLDDELPVEIPRPLPDTTHATPPRTQVDLSLPSLLRSSDNVLLPSFRPSFRQGSHGETEKPRDSSSLVSLEHKFGPRVSAPAETVSQLPQYQQMPTGHMQYHSHRQHAMPHLAAHAMSQYQRHPKPNNAAADKRVLSILRNSLEVRNQQQHKLMAGMDSSSYRLQVPRAMDSASPQFLREARQQAEAMHPPSFSAEAMQPPQFPAEAVPPFSCPPQQAELLQQPPFSDVSPQQQGSELDGLAAFLAARIRTKAELKQCDDGPRQSLQASSGSSPPPPRCPCPGPCVCPEGRLPPSRKTCPCVGPCACPPTVERPSSRKICACLAPCSCPEGPPRALSRKISDTRSSTETSVFDFPDSDPEMAAPASVKDLRRSRKAPSVDTPLELPPSTATPAPPAVEEDPLWASVCSSFVTCLETRGAKTSRAGQHNLALTRKRRLAQEREEPSKVAKSEPPEEETKSEVSKEELELIESCLKATSECKKMLETIPTPPAVTAKPDSSSDSEESLSLAQRLMELPSTTDSSSSSDDSDWSDDVGRAVVTRLQPRSTRSRGGRAYNITTRLRSNQAQPAKRPGRPRRKAKSPEVSSREQSPRPMRRTRQSPDVRRTRRKSPSPELRRSRRKSKSPVSKTRNKSKSPVSKRNKSKSPVSKTRNKSKSPTPNKRSKSKSPVRHKSKSPVRPTVKKSKSPEPTKRSKSPVTRNERQSRKESPDCGFYPGWESELVRFKQSVRMPSNLISVHSRPSSDPPTPTKTRRGVTNSPMSDPGLRGLAAKKLLREMDTSDSSASTPVKRRKHLIRDVECSDSSNHSGRPPKDRKELLAKLANKLRGRGRRKKDEEEGEVKAESEDDEDKRPRVPLRRGLRKRRRSSRLSGPGERRMLRSAALQRSNRALLNSKRHLRRRDLREGGAKPVGAKRGPKGRRKLRSSGFDYLRKKKKKKELSETTPRKVIGVPATRQMASSIEEIASEVRGWVVNKGLGETVLHRAARLCHNDVAAYCLESLGMPPSPRDNAGYTPLHEACARGHLSTARLLLLYGARVDSSAQGGIRPLHEAADCGHIELLRLLLSYGADPLLATYCGQTPLALATSPGARRLLEGHLADVQGRPASPWTLGPRWSQDAEERGDWAGFDVLADAPSYTATCQSEDEMGQFEELPVPTCVAPSTWLLPNDPDVFVLLTDLCASLGRSPDWVRRSLGASLLAKELPRSQFLETARCCHLLAADWSAPKLANLVTLVRSDEAVKRLLLTTTPRSKGGR